MKNYPLTHPNGQLDMRYTLALEYCGHAEKRIVLRFCGEFVDSFRNAPDATLRAIGHRNVLNGAPVFINQPVEGI